MRKTVSIITAGAVGLSCGAAIAKDPAGDHDLPDRIPMIVAYSSTATSAAVYFVRPNGMDGSEISVEPLREPRMLTLVAYGRGAPLTADFESTYKLRPPFK